MNIVMITNTYLPHVCGVSNSIHRFVTVYRGNGHRVLVITPSYENTPEKEIDILRVPAIQNFNQTDFSVSLTIPGFVNQLLDEYQPEIVHSHHPFLLGDAALRIAARRNLPLVFTHHTLYEQYTHYTPVDSPKLQDFVKELSTGYANMCDHAIAPSESIESLMKERGVTTPISVIPTGVDVEKFKKGNAENICSKEKIPQEAFVIGHLGRLAPEKNLEFLSHAVLQYMKEHEETHFLVVGDGPSKSHIQTIFEEAGLSTRLHCTGTLTDQNLIDAYHAMDVFAFASKSETQGMVLIEAMAAGVPVVALDASGSRDVMVHGKNGLLLDRENGDEFVSAFERIASMSESQKSTMRDFTNQFVQSFSTTSCAKQTLDIYETLIRQYSERDREQSGMFLELKQKWLNEWNIWQNRFRAAMTTMQKEE